MPSEPNKHVDELLKASARKRREKTGGPFELHPLARKMLQAEVARLATKNSPARHLNQFLWRLWPRLALVGACAAVLVLAAVISIQIPPDSGSQQAAASKPGPGVEKVLTLNEQAAPEQTRPNIEITKDAGANRGNRIAGIPPADLARDLASLAPPVVTSENFRAEDPHRPGDGKAPVAVDGAGLGGGGNGLAPQSPLQSRAGTEADRRAVQERLVKPATPMLSLATSSEARNPAPSGQSTPTSSPIDPVETNDYFSNNNLSRQRYLQVPDSDKSLPRFAGSAKGVLSAFEIQQNGAALQIFDSDGSVYQGNFEADRATPMGRAGINSGIREQSKSPTADQSPVKKESLSPNLALKQNTVLLRTTADQSTNWQSVAFRVAGTNRSLNKTVVVNGNFRLDRIAASNWNFSVQDQSSATLDSFRRTPNRFNLLQAPISGNVLIGGGNPVQFDAKPVSP